MIPFIPWQKVSAVLAALCAALALWVFVQGQRLDAANARRDLAEVDTRRVLEANGQAARVVTQLREAIEACAGENERILNRYRIAAEQHAAEREAIAAQLANRNRQLRELYARDHDARAWAAVPVPAGVADSLRAEGRGAP